MNNTRACLFLIFLLTSSPGLSQGSPWSYGGPTGPDNWGNITGASACGKGHHQSPINIHSSKTRYEIFPPLVLEGYKLDDSFNEPNILSMLELTSTARPISMVNNGHTIQVNLEGPYQLSGGGLPHTYTAIQFHLHWGSVDSRGSEHILNGRAYPAEMHLVHWDSTTYSSVMDAVAQPNGLAVLGFWIKLGRHNHAWDPIIDHIEAIGNDITPYPITEPFSVSSLLPDDLTRFYRYNGSLTTPGCYESVIWTVFANEIVLSAAQIARLREVYNPNVQHAEHAPEGDGHANPLLEKIQDNYRPVQSLWHRRVYQSWPHRNSDKYRVTSHNLDWVIKNVLKDLYWISKRNSKDLDMVLKK